MQIKFKKLCPEAVAPKQGTPGSAGFDLTATSVSIGLSSYQVICTTGIAVEIPKGYVGLVFPWSSVCNTDLRFSNCVGVIDSDYRGEIIVVFDTLPPRGFQADFGFGFGYQPESYAVGDRFAQLVIVPIPEVEYVEVEELTPTERGAGGYGSTGR